MLILLIILLIVTSVIIVLTDIRQETEQEQAIDINNFEDKSFHNAKRQRLINEFQNLPLTVRK